MPAACNVISVIRTVCPTHAGSAPAPRAECVTVTRRMACAVTGIAWQAGKPQVEQTRMSREGGSRGRAGVLIRAPAHFPVKAASDIASRAALRFKGA